MEDKVFKIEKVIHRVDKYDVYAICKFILASTLFSVNKKVRHTCFKCNHKFQDDDVIYLGLIKKHKNEIFCEKCKFDNNRKETVENRLWISPCWKACCKYKRCTERQADYLDIFHALTQTIIENPNDISKIE